jgi:hypothetical protein
MKPAKYIILLWQGREQAVAFMQQGSGRFIGVQWW